MRHADSSRWRVNFGAWAWMRHEYCLVGAAGDSEVLQALGQEALGWGGGSHVSRRLPECARRWSSMR